MPFGVVGSSNTVAVLEPAVARLELESGPGRFFFLCGESDDGSERFLRWVFPGGVFGAAAAGNISLLSGISPPSSGEAMSLCFVRVLSEKEFKQISKNKNSTTYICISVKKKKKKKGSNTNVLTSSC